MSDAPKIVFSPEEIRALKAFAGFLLRAGAAGATLAPRESADPGSVAVMPASDAELDGAYGDPTVFRDPKKWAGPSYQGARFSRCPTEFLQTLASFLLWRADKEDVEGKKDKKMRPASDWTRKDAARALGWARRNVGKNLPPPAPVGGTDADAEGAGTMEFADDSDVPF